MGRAVALGRRTTPPLPIPETFFRVHQAVLGPPAALVWLNLRWYAHTKEAIADVPQALSTATGLPPSEIDAALDTLIRYGLCERGEEGEWCVHEEVCPHLPAGDGQSEVAAAADPVSAEASAPAPAATEAGNARQADMDAVLQLYHKKIGMLGPTQFEKLRFWVEEQGMAGEVVALAIEETVRQAPHPRIGYLEGILRNWYNDGVRTLDDLAQHKRASSVLGERGAVSAQGGTGGPGLEGAPNAAAYRPVDPRLVRRWKELYPDEYGA
ncbi:MAG TPA: DnaD domain protein [Limnochordia bacterium]